MLLCFAVLYIYKFSDSLSLSKANLCVFQPESLRGILYLLTHFAHKLRTGQKLLCFKDKRLTIYLTLV